MNEILNTAFNIILGAAGTAMAKNLDWFVERVKVLPAIMITDKIPDTVINLLKKILPEKPTQDVFRVTKSAVRLALKATIEDYTKEKRIVNETRKKLKKKVDEIFEQLKDDDWKKIPVENIIEYESYLSENISKWNDLFADELKKTNDIFKNENFEKTFQKYFCKYFGECLKKDHAAFVAYQREMQKLILNAIHELKGENISKVIKESIEQYIKEIPALAVNMEMQEEFAKELSGLKSYFLPKKIIIREKKTDKLLIEIPPNEIKEVGNSYDELQTIIEGKYYFEYNNRLYSIDELNEHTFNYLLGKIKVNQHFIKRMIEAIEDECPPLHAQFYQTIGQQHVGNWYTIPKLRGVGMQLITENFAGIVGAQLESLVSVWKNENERETKYIKQCRYFVEHTIDITIFAFLAQLWDDVHQKKIILDQKKIMPGYFTMNLEMQERISLLRSLIDIYKEQKTIINMLFINDVLTIADCFNESGELYSVCIELEKMGEEENPTALDCYFAEKYLTVFCEHFRFLVNYHIVSMKKIEYISIKNINEGYLHYYVNAGYKFNEKEEEKRNFDNYSETVNKLFTNAVLFYKGNDYKKNINLFPFVIDRNALSMSSDKNSKIAFFKQKSYKPNMLDYAYLSSDKTFELQYRGIAQEKGDKNVVFHTNEDMTVYNQDCVFDSYSEIQKKLFKTV